MFHNHHALYTLVVSLSLAPFAFADDPVARLHAVVHDADSGAPLAARVYLREDDGKWRFARSLAPAGSAVEYQVHRDEKSNEMHTSVSAHPFTADLPMGQHTITVERGKEYLPLTATIEVQERQLGEEIRLEIKLQRFSDVSRDGWFSGETHLHRTLDDLPTAMLAEDLNVALPLTYWVTEAFTPPGQGKRSADAVEPKLIELDATHVIWPLNTEYEIFTVGDKQHMLGAVFALNHKTVLPMGAPPVKPIAEQTHREGGLLELDKHNWPWSMMIAPVMNVDLYELTNNHLWRTEFLYRNWAEAPAEWMHVEQDERGLTERGWLDFTLQNYYLLLNCGLRMRPTAGTASGVHPVPVGFGRVYVHLPEGFSYDAWMRGLNAGRTFVTTGPMLIVEVDGQPPGATIAQADAAKTARQVTGWAKSATPLTGIELVAAGEVVERIEPENRPLPSGGFENAIAIDFASDSSTWLAVRCFEEPAPKRVRFAHSSPVFIDVADRPLRPEKLHVQYLIDRVQTELERNEGVLDGEALDEYRAALAYYQKIASAVE